MKEAVLQHFDLLSDQNDSEAYYEEPYLDDEDAYLYENDLKEAVLEHNELIDQLERTSNAIQNSRSVKDSVIEHQHLIAELEDYGRLRQ